MARIIFTLEDGSEIDAELLQGTITVGREPGNDVVLPSASVSMNHATIKCRGGSYFVLDHGSTNGTKINGVEIDEAKLEDGDRLYFGDIAAVFQLRDAKVGKVAEAPEEDEAVALAPKPAVRSGAQRGVRSGARPGVRRGYAAPTGDQSSAFTRIFPILVFLTMAFIAGLFIRHYVEFERFLLTDVVKTVREKFFDAVTEAALKKEKQGK